MPGRLRYLVGAPVEDQPTYGASGAGVAEVNTGVVTQLPGALRTLAYAG